jgi:hypothetical protein
MGVGPQAGWLLKLFGAHVHQAFGHTAYHVGSSLTEKRGWRDVDVRLMLPDDEYAAYFGDWQTPEYNGSKRLMWNFAWSSLGKQMTGLPIDFQFDPLTLANENHDGPRSALIVLGSELPFVHDAATKRRRR